MTLLRAPARWAHSIMETTLRVCSPSGLLLAGAVASSTRALADAL